MEELYLITVLGKLHIFSIIILAISAFIVVVSICCLCDDDNTKEYINRINGIIKRTSIFVIVSFILVLSIPSEKQLYLLYGGGIVIDYLKSNDNAKEIPDKTLRLVNKALDKFIDDYDVDYTDENDTDNLYLIFYLDYGVMVAQ